jgi:hypothetical protein
MGGGAGISECQPSFLKCNEPAKDLAREAAKVKKLSSVYSQKCLDEINVCSMNVWESAMTITKNKIEKMGKKADTLNDKEREELDKEEMELMKKEMVKCSIAFYKCNKTEKLPSATPTTLATSTAKNAESKICETDYQKCLNERKGPFQKCHETYNTCNTAAQALDKTVSTVANAPRTPTTLTSAPGALAKASGSSAPTAQNINEWRNILDLRSASPYFESTNPDSKYLIDLKTRIENGYNPSAADLKAAQGYGFFASQGDNANSIKTKLAEYIKLRDIVRPHETPVIPKSVITAQNNSTGTRAGSSASGSPGSGSASIADHANSLNSIRSQIRKEVRDAVKEEIDQINNEYELVYE